MKNPAAQADLHESAYFPGFTLTDVRGTWAGQRSPFKVLGHREDLSALGELQSASWPGYQGVSPRNSRNQREPELHE